jgi:hypothetical protein
VVTARAGGPRGDTTPPVGLATITFTSLASANYG